MRTAAVAVPAILIASLAAAQGADRPDPLDPRASAPPLEYRSGFADYRPFAEQDLADWRESNEAVGAAGGHAGHVPARGAGAQTSKPRPGTPDAGDRHGGHGK